MTPKAAWEAHTRSGRRTGFQIIGDAPWGTHFCQFYEDRQDLVDLLVPYFKAGLEDNEFCMWITSEPLGAEEAQAALGRAVPDLDARFRNQQIEILDYSRWYARDGSFDADRVLRGWVDKLESARARGFDGLRLTGDTFWLEKKHWRSFTEYEAAVDNAIGRHPMLAMCTYSLARCGALEITDVISNHAFALIKRGGQWRVIESAERKRIEVSLRESEERYLRLFSSMNEGCAICDMIFDERGQLCDYRYLAVNPAFERLTGLQAECVTGKTARDLLPNLERHWIDLFSSVALTGQAGAREDYAADLGRWYEVRAFRIDAARFAFVFSDVSDRRKAEEALRESEQLFRHAQEMAHLGSWELDLADHRLIWSDEVYRIFGLKPQEFGATYEAFLEAVHPEDRRTVDEAYSGSLREGRDAYEISHRVVRKGTGEVRWVHEKCEHVRDAAGRVIRSWGMVQDITDRQRAEERLRHAQKLESIGLLAGGIAHDFNNLLVGVIGNASLAEEMAPHGSPIREVLNSVIRAGEQAAHLTRQMLAYAGKGQFVLEAVNLSAVVRDTRELLLSLVSKKIALDFQLRPDLPRVECDPSQMQQVLMNLVLNGGEAIGDGPGVISISTGEMAVDGNFIQRELGNWSIEPGLCAMLEVRDTGSGMDETVQARIFDPFFTTKFQGRGLGLAAVAGIVRAQSGAIQVTSAPGCGAAFRVLLPASARRGGETRAAASRAKAVRGSGTVLVIDDEPIVRELAKRLLDRSGYEVLMAANGPAAIDLVRSEGGRIGLALLDVNMPGMGGEEILARLRAIKPDLKVIVSSGYSEGEALRLFHGVAVSGFIQKPYTVDELAGAVQAGMEPNVT